MIVAASVPTLRPKNNPNLLAIVPRVSFKNVWVDRLRDHDVDIDQSYESDPKTNAVEENHGYVVAAKKNKTRAVPVVVNEAASTYDESLRNELRLEGSVPQLGPFQDWVKDAKTTGVDLENSFYIDAENNRVVLENDFVLLPEVVEHDVRNFHVLEASRAPSLDLNEPNVSAPKLPGNVKNDTTTPTKVDLKVVQVSREAEHLIFRHFVEDNKIESYLDFTGKVIGFLRGEDLDVQDDRSLGSDAAVNFAEVVSEVFGAINQLNKTDAKLREYAWANEEMPEFTAVSHYKTRGLSHVVGANVEELEGPPNAFIGERSRARVPRPSVSDNEALGLAARARSSFVVTPTLPWTTEAPFGFLELKEKSLEDIKLRRDEDDFPVPEYIYEDEAEPSLKDVLKTRLLDELRGEVNAAVAAIRYDVTVREALDNGSVPGGADRFFFPINGNPYHKLLSQSDDMPVELLKGPNVQKTITNRGQPLVDTKRPINLDGGSPQYWKRMGARSHRRTSVQELSARGPDWMSNQFDAFLLWDPLGVVVRKEKETEEAHARREEMSKRADVREADMTSNVHGKVLSYDGFACRFATVSVQLPLRETVDVPFLQRTVPMVKSTVTSKTTGSFTFDLDEGLFWLERFHRISGHPIASTASMRGDDPGHVLIQTINGFGKKDYDELGANPAILLNAISNVMPKKRYGSLGLCLVIKGTRLSDWVDASTQPYELPYYVFEDVTFLGTDSLKYTRDQTGLTKTTVEFAFRRFVKTKPIRLLDDAKASDAVTPEGDQKEITKARNVLPVGIDLTSAGDFAGRWFSVSEGAGAFAHALSDLEEELKLEETKALSRLPSSMKLAYNPVVDLKAKLQDLIEKYEEEQRKAYVAFYGLTT